MELSLACDFRIMARGSKHDPYHLAQIESLVGLVPGSGGMHSLTRLIGEARALQYCMLGTRLTADEAQRLGLITQAVDEEALESSCRELAGQLARRSPLSLRHIKTCIHKGQGRPFASALKLDEPAFMDTACSAPAIRARDWQREALAKGKSVNQAFNEHEMLDLNASV